MLMQINPGWETNQELEIPLAAMRVSESGEEGEELSAVLLMDMLGVATGAGLGGAAIALSGALDASLRAGLAGAFALALVAALVLLAITPRIPSGPQTVSTETP